MLPDVVFTTFSVLKMIQYLLVRLGLHTGLTPQQELALTIVALHGVNIGAHCLCGLPQHHLARD